MIVNGSTLTDISCFLEQFAAEPEVPSYFGKNLDALDEVLGDGFGPAEICWKNAEESRRKLGQDFERLSSVLRDHVISDVVLADEWRLKFR